MLLSFPLLRFAPIITLALGSLIVVPVQAETPDMFARENLVAWCIVPFDGKKRGPEDRAAMLEALGFHRLAYDYRAEHIPTWDREMDALKKHGIELFAWWFPGTLDAEAKQALELFKRHNVKPQLWISGAGAPVNSPAEQQARIESEAARIQTLATAASALGLKVGLYNHGGWFGEPENQIAIIERLERNGVKNVGIVYNLHHGHDHLDRFAELMAKMKPHLLALNLNGMTRNGDKIGKKILVLGEGEEDVRLLKLIRESGWSGPIGILNHTDEDAEVRLKANLQGLERIVKTGASSG
jgi:sugar phosphate isomerase/epimerase